MSFAGSEDKPIYSSRVDDVEFREAIDEFVVGLAERIDQLQDAEARRDLKLLAELCRPLIDAAPQLGFEPLSRCAEAVAGACRAQDPSGALRYLVDLTQIARRIRLGHRGAV